MKKIIINATIFTMLGVTLVYYAYTRHGDFGASFGGSMLGGMTGSMIGSAMTKEKQPPAQTVVVERPVEKIVEKKEGITAEDVQENLDDLRRVFKKDLNILNDRIDTILNELKAENKKLGSRLDECEATIKTLQEKLKIQAKEAPVLEPAKEMPKEPVLAPVLEPAKEAPKEPLLDADEELDESE